MHILEWARKAIPYPREKRNLRFIDLELLEYLVEVSISFEMAFCQEKVPWRHEMEGEEQNFQKAPLTPREIWPFAK